MDVTFSQNLAKLSMHVYSETDETLTRKTVSVLDPFTLSSSGKYCLLLSFF